MRTKNEIIGVVGVVCILLGLVFILSGCLSSGKGDVFNVELSGVTLRVEGYPGSSPLQLLIGGSDNTITIAHGVNLTHINFLMSGGNTVYVSHNHTFSLEGNTEGNVVDYYD